METYEYLTIENEKLPESWRESLNGLNDFLQSNWRERVALYNDEKTSSKQQFITINSNGDIHPEGYVGTIVYKGEQLDIYPRVFKENINNKSLDGIDRSYMMNNLIQWISYCSKFDYPYLNIKAEIDDAQNLRDLFIALYIAYIEHALERGMYYQYVDETKDIRAIKGKFNVKDYIINKIPNGKYDEFECEYSKFEFDNLVNRIIKYTCYKLHKTVSVKYQKRIRKILTHFEEVSLETCKPRDCDIVRLDRNHDNYRKIIYMSKMFLINMMSNMTMDMNESFCFLFPTNILFEGFIGGMMKEVIKKEGGKVSLQKNDMYLLDSVQYAGHTLSASHKMRHDIYVEYKDKCFILDTKYKEVERFEGSLSNVKSIVDYELAQADLYQVCEYARVRDLKEVFLLYPMYKPEDIELEFPVGDSKGIKVHFVRLPFVFNDNEEIVKERLKTVILNILK